MSEIVTSEPTQRIFDPMNPPDHKHLPEKDGSIVNNYQEHPQSALLAEILTPRLREIQPDGNFSMGADSGIYWRHAQQPLDGCKSPDWFCVLGVPPLLNGELRRSYVLWMEAVAPLLIVEYVSGDGSDERDKTPLTGKFWVYERGIRAPFYAIFDGFRRTLEVHHLNGGGYHPVEANEQGRYPIAPLRIELGLWRGRFWEQDATWLRAWDATTKQMLPGATERAELAEDLLDETRQLLQEETERAENERKRALRLAAKLRALGVDPDAA